MFTGKSRDESRVKIRDAEGRMVLREEVASQHTSGFDINLEKGWLSTFCAPIMVGWRPPPFSMVNKRKRVWSGRLLGWPPPIF